MKKKDANKYRIQYLYRPGLKLNDQQRAELVEHFRDCASTCFDEIPDYQVMRGTQEELSDKVIAVAWRKSDGRMAGFCSTILIPVTGVGNVMHLGLTCVRPEDRSSGLTHILTHKAVAGYLFRRKPLGRVWITNCAAVLSSLGNVALHFEKIYPAPSGNMMPSKTHMKIAKEISETCRDAIYIHDHAEFDPVHFVFRGSVEDTVFQKDEEDERFHHRNCELNDYYLSIMDFDNGDEVLQIGYASPLTGLKHMYHKAVRCRKQAVSKRPMRQLPA